MTLSLKDRLHALRDHLLTDLIERDTPMRLSLLAALAGEHLLLIGPPGTAKSEMAKRLRAAFRDANYFERLLTRFSVPEELFGPLSIKALEEDRYQRQISGYLPSASVAFLDEIFKANSAILNSLLTLLNEREFDNGTQRIKTPLICVVAASNELPDGEEMDALYDRFLLRCQVLPISEAAFPSLLALRGAFQPQPNLDLRLSPEDLGQIRKDALLVGIPAAVTELLIAMRSFCNAQHIPVSDRRWRKILFLLQVAAYTDGRNEVSQWDCWLLQHCLWNEPEQQEPLFDWYKSRVGAKDASPERFAKVTATWEKTLDGERNSKTQALDRQGKPLFLAANGKSTTLAEGQRQRVNDKGEPLFLMHPDYTRERTNGGKGYAKEELIDYLESHHGSGRAQQLRRDTAYWQDTGNWIIEKYTLPPQMEPTRYSEAHVQGRQSAVSALKKDISSHIDDLQKQISSLSKTIAEHLWISPGFSQVARANLETLLKQHQDQEKRLAKVLDGFGALPRTEQ